MEVPTVNQREAIIQLWFNMWLQQKDLGIDDIFTKDVVYIESWSPKYENRATVKHWFEEWNTRGKVLVWNIKQYFHKENQTIVEWYFKNEMNNGDVYKRQVQNLVDYLISTFGRHYISSGE